MDRTDDLAARFDESRGHLFSVAYRMLGSTGDAEDAVQEAWIRLTRADHDQVRNLTGWLTTVVARVCLDMLRSRTSRREQPWEDHPIEQPTQAPGPEDEAVVADSVGAALLLVLDTLSPAERLAFVLHDLFAVPFDEIAPIVGTSPAAARQLASRARRRVQGAPAAPTDRDRKREIVEAFLAASRGGDFGALLALLDPAAVLRSDAAAVEMGSDPEVNGAEAVARTFAGRARAARLADIDGEPGALWSAGGVPRVAFAFTITDGRITAIDLLADPSRLETFLNRPTED
ncbi:sigma-70 family RNA polymerase sigma factor [Nakamurella sp. GG22]